MRTGRSSVSRRPTSIVGAVVLCLSAVIATNSVPASASTPAAGYGGGQGYCATYQGGKASSFSFGNVWACGGATTGDTTFDAPGVGVFAWQCVELSARFLWADHGIWAGPGSGYSKGADLVAAVHHKHTSIKVGTPGPGSLPAAGDVASFGPGGAVDGTVGHTAIVISADTTTGRFETLSENFSSSGADGAPGMQFWQVRLSGGKDGYVQYLGGPGHPRMGAWTKASWLELTPVWSINPMPNRGGTNGSTAWKISSSGTRDAWAVGGGASGVVWHAAPAEGGWAPLAAPGGPAGTQFIDVSTSGAVTWVLGTRQYVIEWDGNHWLSRSTKTLPTQFTAQAIVAQGDTAWLVGSLYSNPATERWNGLRWEFVPSHSFAGGGVSTFDSVVAVGPNQLIAVGIRNAQACEGGEPFAEFYNGHTWSIMSVPVPEAKLYECNYEPAPALNATWFSIPGTIDGTTSPILYRRIGSAWRLTSMSSPHASNYWALSGFADSSSRSSWAVGQYYLGATGSGNNYPLVEHWNGSAWELMSIPQPSSNAWLESVTTVPGSCQIDAIGNYSRALYATNYPFGESYC